MNTDMLLLQTLVWEADREVETNGYATEMKEYERDNPRPNLKEFLVGNKGWLNPMV